MRILELLACLYVTRLFWRGQSMWHDVYKELTVEHNILNIVLCLGSFLILIKMWMIFMRIGFKLRRKNEPN